MQRKNLDLSEFVSNAIQEKLANTPQSASFYELGKQLFGRHASRKTQCSSQRKQLLRQEIHAKHRGK